MLECMAPVRPIPTIIEHATTEDFFRRGREIARLADRRGKLKARRIVSFDDPGEMAVLLAPRRFALLLAVWQRAGTIADLAARLQRSTRAVSRDVVLFARLGILVVEHSQNAPLGMNRKVRAVADKLVLTCVVGQ